MITESTWKTYCGIADCSWLGVLPWNSERSGFCPYDSYNESEFE
jgi:hypothetical protein